MNARTRESETAALVTEVLITAIEPHPDNPRTFPKDDGADPGLVELAASIKAVGLLEPVLVRPLASASTKNQGYQLVAGERRWRASRLAGLERIPAIVRALDDRQTLEIQVTENLQRKDLSPLEEARGVRALVDRAGWTVQDVADRLGRSLHWVAQRARLAELSERWRKAVEDPNLPVAGWPVALLVMVARLEPAAQDELAVRTRWLDPRETWDPSADQVAREIADMVRTLKSAPWKLDDEALHPKAGSCRACLKRSAAHPGLFEDEDPEKPAKTDRCLDATCWTEKARRHVAVKEAELKAAHPNLVLVNGHNIYDEEERKDAVRSYDVAPAKKGAPGAVPALIVTGPEMGTLRWVMPPRREFGSRRPKGADGEPKPKTMAERRAGLERRHKAKAVELIKLRIEGIRPYPQFPDAAAPAAHATRLLLAMAAMFGTKHQRNSSQWDGGYRYEARSGKLKGPQAAWKLLQTLRDDGEKCCAELWAEVRLVLLERLAYLGSQTDMRKLWDDAERQCEVLGLDAAAALAEAVAAIPEPKSWAGLNANGTPKKKAEAAKRLATDQKIVDREVKKIQAKAGKKGKAETAAPAPEAAP